MFSGPDVAFASKPVFHAALEAIERDTKADLHQAVGDGERVVEDGVVGEVAHREAVDPSDGAGVCRAFRVDAVDLQTKSEHDRRLRLRQRG